jgi:hypothetical protein
VTTSRRQTPIWCRNTVRAGVLAVLSISAAWAEKPKTDRSYFCVTSTGGAWALQAYPPLIDLNRQTVFLQAIYDGPRLELIRIRRYNPAYELVFEYKFDQAGKLGALHGMLRKWGDWLAEADLFPAADGKVPPPRVRYSGGYGRDNMTEPEDGPNYTPAFLQVPVYRTIQEIPCAGLLKEMEKKNATQE